MVCDTREKDVDIAFAQDAIDEFKVVCNLNLLRVYKFLAFKGRLNIGSYVYFTAVVRSCVVVLV